jgi:hypothetical protein
VRATTCGFCLDERSFVRLGKDWSAWSVARYEVSNDPVFLNRTSHIFYQLYDGGYSAVVDAFKYFYLFKTRPEDRQYLGVQRPRNLDEFLIYAGLPMGAGNSPAFSGKFGLSFIRMLKARFSVFQGTPRANCFWTGFSEMGEYDSKLGYG